MSVIDRYLAKLGIKDYSSMSLEEKATMREWEAALQGRQLTQTDVRTFLDIELENAISRLTETGLKPEDEVFRKVEVRFIKKIMSFLNMPALEKKVVEEQLKAQL